MSLLSTDELGALYERLSALAKAGKEEEAKKLLLDSSAGLPEELRAKIMLDMLTDGLEQKVDGLELKRLLQEAGLEAAQKLKEGKLA
jgi:hypothetical protein